MKEASEEEMKNQYKNSKQIGGACRIHCDQTGESWARVSANLRGARNRFAFQCTTNLCPEAAMSPVWKRYGAACFTFEILEEIEKRETQAPHEFSKDVSALLELWNEKQDDGGERIGTKQKDCPFLEFRGEGHTAAPKKQCAIRGAGGFGAAV